MLTDPLSHPTALKLCEAVVSGEPGAVEVLADWLDETGFPAGWLRSVGQRINVTETHFRGRWLVAMGGMSYITPPGASLSSPAGRTWTVLAAALAEAADRLAARAAAKTP